MKKSNGILRMVCLAAGLLAFVVNGYSWGQKGHDVTCAVAQNHLTRKAKKQISNILDGKSIVYWANWMDNASHTPDYRYTLTWHYKNIDADETFGQALLNENGDVVRAINEQIDALKSGKLSKEEQALSLKFLVHLMGDLHCPMHLGHRSDLGGNRWQVQYFGKGTTFIPYGTQHSSRAPTNGHIQSGSIRSTLSVRRRTARSPKAPLPPGASRPTRSAAPSMTPPPSAPNSPTTTSAPGPRPSSSSSSAPACASPRC